MKVLFIHSSGNNIAGSEIILLKMLKHLHPSIEKSVLLPEKGIFYDRLKQEKQQVYLSSFKGFYRKKPVSYLKELWTFAKVVREIQPDLIHTSTAGPVQYAYPLSKYLGIPLVCHIQCPYSKDDLRRYFPHKATKIIAISQTLKDIFDPKYKDKIKVIYSGIPTPNLNRQVMRARILNQFGLGSEALLLGILGQIIPRKGIRLFLKAAKQIVSELPQTRFLIVGDEKNEHGLMMKQLSKELGIEKYVIWAGYQTNSQEWMAGMDILAVPSKSEGFGLVAAEAGAVGTPVIASDVDGLPEIIEHGLNGYLIPVGDESAFVFYAKKLLLDEKKRAQMASQGKQKVQKTFSFEKSMEGIERIYSELLPSVAFKGVQDKAACTPS
ncbi:MAG: hypothetical protein COB67_11230 [SAR324 cluster bacterium]|uniref:Glycosyltransferase family 1 protein n=1 Tax=SAR324 cluster bacterium TaxID=2024889 RepID=A0A2A4SVM1_9DELT|nr:MAG: hypothetical protein COB67_11230 [SAR324 cluster bacterium]